jgi:uncharacterized circularly permuted ATP-grasp superfamily protein/uncharacterized alpha-E superfamily protein
MLAPQPSENPVIQPYLQPLVGQWDESLGDDDLLLPEYTRLFDAYNRIPTEEFQRRWRLAKRLLRDNGVVFDVYSDEPDGNRPWQLDPLPLLLDHQEWAHLEQGIRQRATLLNLIAQDIYGPQRMLKERLVPAEIVFGNEVFLRSCFQILPENSVWINFYAADLIRNKSGVWHVVGDRTQAPVGIAYSVENRSTCHRIMPQLLEEMGAARLLPFLEKTREFLNRLSPETGATSPASLRPPQTVLLTRGPASQSYFEHAYLAKLMEVPLVEPEDLIMREGGIWIKTLAGLQQVDGIARRLKDTDADPLELRSDGGEGVAGLLESVRLGKVKVANALGSGALEVQGLLPYLPRLAQFFMNEELQLPSIDTWWCGDSVGREHVLANLEQVVVKPALSRRCRESIFCCDLSAQQLDKLRGRIEANPSEYVGQALIDASTAPVWTSADQPLQPRRLALRLQSLMTRPDDVDVMPGGLALTAISPESKVVALEQRGGCKDVWVLNAPSGALPRHLSSDSDFAGGVASTQTGAPGDQSQALHSENRTATPLPIPDFSGTPTTSELLAWQTKPLEIKRAGRDLPSRVAENFFWLGRYAERTEALSRLLRHLTLWAIDAEPNAKPTPAIDHVLSFSQSLIHGDYSSSLQALPRQVQHPPFGELMRLAVGDQDLPGALPSNLRSMHRNAWRVKDRLSQDAWRALSFLRAAWERNAPEASDTGPPLIGGESVQTMNDDSSPMFTSVSSRSGNDGSKWLWSDLLIRLDQVLLHLSAFSGLSQESMTRAHGWRFLDLGRRLERGLQHVQLLGGMLVHARTDPQPVLKAGLEIADVAMTYRSRYLNQMYPVAVLDLILADPTNPRSVIFQLEAILAHLRHLPEQHGVIPGPTLVEKLGLTAHNKLVMADVFQMAEVWENGLRPDLAELLQDLNRDLLALSDALGEQWFVHTVASQQGNQSAHLE